MATRNHTPFVQLDLPFGPHEEWKPVPGYEGYHVSNLGRIKSLSRLIRAGNGLRQTQECILKQVCHTGYLWVELWSERKPKRVSAHYLVLIAFVGPRLPGFQANHIDGNKRNNRPDNLEWVTAQENTLHAVRTGLKDIGERHYYAKLTAQQVQEIRAMSAQGVGPRRLARLFGVTHTNIGHIVHRRNWKSIP